MYPRTLLRAPLSDDAAASPSLETGGKDEEDGRLLKILEAVKLGGLAAKWGMTSTGDNLAAALRGLDAEVDWGSVLSLGEQQRLGIPMPRR